MQTFTDQLGHQITLPFPPQRIISLVPSQTELLADLGLDQTIVGITKFCVHPQSWQKAKTIVGGTKKFRFDVIESLRPDLILGNKEENYLEGIEELRSKFPIWMSDIVTLKDAFSMIDQIGELTGTSVRAVQLLNQIQESFSAIEKLPSLQTLYLIWQNPWMGAAPGTFIHELMTVAGLQNCLSYHTRYPELDEEEIKSLNPELILLSSEPYPFVRKHMNEMSKLFPKAKIVMVDGEMFSWYGSRLLKFPEYLKLLKSQLS
ncbi:MAG TPA: helical backbone metal receptor [Cyclobacteriaceae bacterium]|nr:helical backbone metal receptor [Cyclobacteriaceae bacterium]